MKQIFFILLIYISHAPVIVTASPQENKPIRVGWIGGMTGATAKWGVYQAAMLGVEDVNTHGGINGRPLELIYEDAHCSSSAAISSFTKLVNVDRVSFILGGHCSPESLAFAPLAERKKIVSIAAITSSPKLSDMGDYIFRVTPISTRLADLVAPYAYSELNVRKLALVYELTDYVVPVVEHFKAIFKEKGGEITSDISFNPGETDFASIILKGVKAGVDGIYFGVQAPDTAILLMKKMRELQLTPKVFGNEQFAGAFLSASDTERLLLDGVVFAEPQCELSSPSIKNFSEKYKKRYQVRDLPFGCYTGEPYDAVQILADALRRCGEVADCVKEELYKVRDYNGASGSITFDSNGDVDKRYVIKTIHNGKINIIEPNN